MCCARLLGFMHSLRHQAYLAFYPDNEGLESFRVTPEDVSQKLTEVDQELQGE